MSTKSQLKCVLPTEAQVENLLAMIPMVSKDPRVVDWSVPLLQCYGCKKYSVQFGSIARTVTKNGKLVGFFAANLVSNEQGNSLFESKSKHDYWNHLLFSPLDSDEIAILKPGTGATLVITEFFWNPSLISKTDFSSIALEHIRRCSYR